MTIETIVTGSGSDWRTHTCPSTCQLPAVAISAMPLYRAGGES